jgi:hypothetical protein
VPAKQSDTARRIRKPLPLYPGSLPLGRLYVGFSGAVPPAQFKDKPWDPVVKIAKRFFVFVKLIGRSIPCACGGSAFTEMCGWGIKRNCARAASVAFRLFVVPPVGYWWLSPTKIAQTSSINEHLYRGLKDTIVLIVTAMKQRISKRLFDTSVDIAVKKELRKLLHAFKNLEIQIRKNSESSIVRELYPYSDSLSELKDSTEKICKKLRISI